MPPVSCLSVSKTALLLLSDLCHNVTANSHIFSVIYATQITCTSCCILAFSCCYSFISSLFVVKLVSLWIFFCVQPVHSIPLFGCLSSFLSLSLPLFSFLILLIYCLRVPESTLYSILKDVFSHISVHLPNPHILQGLSVPTNSASHFPYAL